MKKESSTNIYMRTAFIKLALFRIIYKQMFNDSLTHCLKFLIYNIYICFLVENNCNYNFLLYSLQFQRYYVELVTVLNFVLHVHEFWYFCARIYLPCVRTFMFCTRIYILYFLCTTFFYFVYDLSFSCTWSSCTKLIFPRIKCNKICIFFIPVIIFLKVVKCKKKNMQNVKICSRKEVAI